MTSEQAHDVNSSQNWVAVCEEIDSWIKVEEAKLRVCMPEQLLDIQHQIATLERVKRLPQIVIDREE